MLGEPASYAKPLITPDGQSIVFTIRREGAVDAIDWDGGRLRRVTEGFGLDVWADPADGTMWIYVGGDEAPTDPPTYPVVRRHRLDDPAVFEVVWDAQPVAGDTFQLAANGRTAAAMLPWPTAGVIDLASGTWRKLGEGCWTAFSPGADPLFWYFDGAHRNLTIVDVDTDERRHRGDRRHHGCAAGATGLFFAPELRHVSLGAFWGERAAEVNRARRASAADPLPAILDFAVRLDVTGVDLLVVPVPPKAVVYADELSSSLDVASPPPRLDPDHQTFYARLRGSGVDVLDLTEPLLAARDHLEGPVYCRHDTH